MLNVGARFGFRDSLVPLSSMWGATSAAYACLQALRVILATFPECAPQPFRNAHTIADNVHENGGALDSISRWARIQSI
jgi:hypothetical protein